MICVSDYRDVYFRRAPSVFIAHSEGDRGKEVRVRSEVLAWDSKIFQFPVGRIHEISFDSSEIDEACAQLEAAIAAFRSAGVRFCDIRVDEGQGAIISMLEKRGFSFIERLQIYWMSAERCRSSMSSVSAGTVKIRSFEKGDDSSLRPLAAGSFKTSRIYKDSKIEEGVSSLFYESLFVSLLDKPSTYARVASNADGVPIGFLLANIDEFGGTPLIVLWMIAVSDEAQGQGVGRDLLMDLMKHCGYNNFLLEIGTQVENKPANKLYLRSGLEPLTTVRTYHLWL